ncbi:MAG: type II toxin-antitoxin system HicA family toxin [Deltaproteobacteria bacterium]|nr:type II toxin-antitoxin system HicA family toxin [Deltaproteobacteria bacterium]
MAPPSETDQTGWETIGKVLEARGWEFLRKNGFNAVYIHPDKPRPVIINCLMGLDKAQVARVFRQAGISPDDIQRLIRNP